MIRFGAIGKYLSIINFEIWGYPENILSGCQGLAMPLLLLTVLLILSVLHLIWVGITLMLYSSYESIKYHIYN